MAIKDGGMKTNGPKGGTQRSAWGQWVGGPRTDRPGQTHTHPHPDGRRGGGGARGACGRGMRGTTGWRAMGTGGGAVGWDMGGGPAPPGKRLPNGADTLWQSVGRRDQWGGEHILEALRQGIPADIRANDGSWQL